MNKGNQTGKEEIIRLADHVPEFREMLKEFGMYECQLLDFIPGSFENHEEFVCIALPETQAYRDAQAEKFANEQFILICKLERFFSQTFIQSKCLDEMDKVGFYYRRMTSAMFSEAQKIAVTDVAAAYNYLDSVMKTVEKDCEEYHHDGESFLQHD